MQVVSQRNEIIRWKERSQTIMDTYGKVDPEEYKALLDEKAGWDLAKEQLNNELESAAAAQVSHLARQPLGDRQHDTATAMLSSRRKQIKLRLARRRTMLRCQPAMKHSKANTRKCLRFLESSESSAMSSKPR